MDFREHPGLDRGLLRFAAVSQVEAFVAGGMSLAAAIDRVSEIGILSDDGRIRKHKRASLYRWYRSFKRQKFPALLDSFRRGKLYALERPFLDFLFNEKTQDPEASIPEVIRRAVERGVISNADRIDRTTVYRAARRHNLPMFRRRKAETTAMRPFAYANRMQMVLCDGKHFRAGGGRLKRLALFFIDDATSYVFDVFVSDAGEEATFFLRSLFSVIMTYGYMGILFLDNGPGFKADDTKLVMASMGVPLVLGTAGYPEGHGKIERFNDTVQQQVLRGLCKPDIDPDPKALEIRIRHYLRERYNETFHEGIKGIPRVRFEMDEALLRFPESEEELRRSFVISSTRKVRKDNVIPYDDLIYEVPLGHAGRRIPVFRDVISGDLSVLHEGKAVKILPPDLAANARDRRDREPVTVVPRRPVTTAAEMHFNRDLGPMVGPDGGFALPTDTED